MKSFLVSILLLVLLATVLNYSVFSQSHFVKKQPNYVKFNQSKPVLFDEEHKYVFATNIKEFFVKLNEYGELGYKLEHLTKLPLYKGEDVFQMKLAAVVKRDGENKYEYDWFESFIPAEIVTRIDYRAKQGFYFKDILPVAYKACEDVYEHSDWKTETDRIFADLSNYRNISYGSVIILERKNKLIGRKEYRVEIAQMGWGKKPEVEMENIFNSFSKRGFKPIAIRAYKILNNHAFAILTEEIEEAENKRNEQFKVIKADKNYDKKVNLLAKEGYEIVFDVSLGIRLIVLKKMTKIQF